MILPVEKILFARYVQDWCRVPYEGYPDGCPMYGTRGECPPQAEYFSDIVYMDGYIRDDIIPDITNTDRFLLVKGQTPTMFLVMEEFDLEAHMKVMVDKHKDWTPKQQANPRYYQRGLDSRIKKLAEEYIKDKKLTDSYIIKRPEAHGVNLFATCAMHGIILKRKYPVKKVCKMVMIVRQKFSVSRWFE